VTFGVLRSSDVSSLECKKQAIELWSVLCDTEIMLLFEMKDFLSKNRQPLYLQMQQRFMEQKQRMYQGTYPEVPAEGSATAKVGQEEEEGSATEAVATEEEGKEPEGKGKVKQMKRHRSKRPREQKPVFPFHACHFLIKKVAPDLVPLLLTALSLVREEATATSSGGPSSAKISVAGVPPPKPSGSSPAPASVNPGRGAPPSPSESHWYLWMAAYVALELVALLTNDEVVDLVMPYIHENLASRVCSLFFFWLPEFHVFWISSRVPLCF
jgi:hypothetical protein